MHCNRKAAGFIVGLMVSTGPVAISNGQLTDQQRLDRLAERIESARVEQHIPGLALAVVRDDRVIFAQGFGQANVEQDIAVTPETIFAIGSTTKAFTSALLAMEMDDGLLTWDDPVSKWLPEFTPKIDADDGEQMLIRDMLCHRTGFTRMSMLFISGKASREEILQTASGAEPYAPFREEFLYNNVMFMAAGMIAGRAADSSWETLMHERIFEPLGMDDSVLTIAEAQADPRLALGYSWKDDAFEHQPMRNIDAIGPAGSVNSNVLDMANWVRLQLGHGVFEGQRLISDANMDEMWKPQQSVGGGIDYGFGWMLRDWNGQRVVEHGGNIDGFAAEVALLPGENIGFVLLTNTSFAALQTGSINIVFDSILGNWGDSAQADDSGNAPHAGQPSNDTLTGVYIANHASFKDEPFTVTVNDDGNLVLDIPSQRKFVIGQPGDDGRRPFAEVPGLAASFTIGEDGKAEIMTLYQGGLKFEVPREGYTFPIEVPLERLEKYLGRYHFDAMNADLTVMVKNNHLAVDVPGQMVFELSPPDDDDKWAFRASDTMKIAVSFTKDSFGAVESMTLYQAGQEFTMPRLVETPAEDLPSLDDVYALARLDERQAALTGAKTVRLSGTGRFAQSGIEGSVALTFDEGSSYLNEIDLGSFGTIRIITDGKTGWRDMSFSPLDELTGLELEQARGEHPAALVGDWRIFHDEIRVVRLDELDSVPVIVLEAADKDLPTTTIYLDKESGDVLGIDSATVVPELGNARLPTTTRISGWHDQKGLWIPSTIIVENQQNGRFIMSLDRVETGLDAPAYTPKPRED